MRTTSKIAPAKKRKISIDTRKLDEMAAEATMDAYGESEQISGWYCMFDEHLVVPFETSVLGVTVVVETIDLRGDTRIVAICKRGAVRQAIDVLELPLPSPRPAGAEWVDAYRHWRKGW